MMIWVMVGGSVFAGPLSTDLGKGDLDGTTFGQWVEGVETPVVVEKDRSATWIVWTKETTPGHNGVAFGNSKTPGVRHLRVGFTKAIEMGTVLTRAGAGVRLSYLKSDAAYPGDLAKDEQWSAAQRAGESEYSLWLLPAGTATRALRLTYEAPVTAKTYAGNVGGIFVLKERLANLSGSAVVATNARPASAGMLVDGKDNSWSPWSSEDTGPVVSEEQPQVVTLAWPGEVALRGLATMSAGFGEAKIQAYSGPTEKHPREGADADWTTVATIKGLRPHYPRPLGPDFFAFEKEVKTRGLRLVITGAIDDTKAHPHMKGNAKGGRRVWVHEVMALAEVGKGGLESVAVAGKGAETHPPIPIRFSLKEDAFVTLVIEDEKGNRVRNLVSETKFPAGENVAWWDGLDDVGRDFEAPHHGIYHVPGQFVSPGKYRVRGIARAGVDLKYEFAVYSPGNPPWATADKTGGWIADHSAPSGALNLPGEKPRVLVSSHVAEGGDGLVYLDMEGKKVGAIHWIGGNWTGATHLARDVGEKRVAEVHAYAVAPWEEDKDKTKGEVRLTALTDSGPKALYKHKVASKAEAEVSGLAVHNGVIVVGLAKRGELLLVDAVKGSVMGTHSLADVQGLCFAPDGSLLAVVGKTVVRFASAQLPLAAGKVIVADQLEAPQQLALDSAGNIYVSDWGKSHQVKVFSAEGKFLRAIGTAGAPVVGPYDANHMNHPHGLTIDAQGRLWVAEHNFYPKRISIWEAASGKLLRAFYGPPQYGGGGTIDAQDKSRFLYGGMEFRIDWASGAAELVNVYFRPDALMKSPNHHGSGSEGAPELLIRCNGREYLVNNFNAHPTNGTTNLVLFRYEKGVAIPCMSMGRAEEWELLKTDALRPKWPLDFADPKNKGKLREINYLWSDLNNDRQVQGDEVQFYNGPKGPVLAMADLTLVTGASLALKPVKFTDAGTPVYDLAAGKTLVPGARMSSGSGGGQVFTCADGRVILTCPPEPFPKQSSMSGAKDGVCTWTYPSLWNGLHASHHAPLPTHAGQLIGTTRLLGYPFKVKDDVELWAVNGNKGNVYLFTTDGLFVATLFKDGRLASWSIPQATRGMKVNDSSLNEECFWPSITRTQSGETYIVAGVQTTCSILKVENLETIVRLADQAIELSADDLAAAKAYFVEQAAAKQQQQGRDTLTMAIVANAPALDGKLDEWPAGDFVTIDTRRKQTGDWSSVEEKAQGAAMISGEMLYLAYRTNDKDLLRNTGESKELLFKTGGCLDLMLGVDAKADPKRDKPVEGDLRLLVTMVKGKPTAMLYRAVVPGTAQPVPFRAPWHSITLDRVDEVSDQVQLAHDGTGNFEVAVPLKLLGLEVKSGQVINGDLGLLRGNGFATLQRVYWSNRATNLTADVPSEAQLTPRLWGRIVMK